MKEEILKLRSQGLTYRQIKEKLNCSLGVISYHCTPSQGADRADRQRDKRSTNRKKLQEYKSDKPCVDCGETYPYWVMDFDHLHSKSSNVSLMMNQSWDTILLEIAKCEIVCANCHRMRTWNRLVKTGSDTIDYLDD